jgi:D-3-phosphoglycerate dehydrogenase
MAPIIAILDTGYKSYLYEKELFEKHGFSLALYNGDPHDSLAKRDFARDAAGILIRGTEVAGDFFDRLPNLKAVVRYGVGYDNVNIADATARGIRVANVQGYASHSVSDHALALIYACTRGLQIGIQHFHSIFTAPPFEDVFELHDKTLGIVGLGRIGSHLAKKAAGLFASVLAVDPYQPDESFVSCRAQRTHLKTLLQRSHVISLHCNLTEETFHLLDEEAFSFMDKRPVIINTSRGPVVDEKALSDALQNNRIHSAGLDVFENEPPTAAQDYLLNHPRVIATGHYAWYSDAAMIQLQRRAADNMIGLLNGEEIDDCLNPKRR